MRLSTCERLLNILGESRTDIPEGRPPGSTQRLRFGPPDDAQGDGPSFVAESLNDGFELWVGYPDRWLFHCRHEDARRLARFILWECWAKGTWFGLKRWLYYLILRRVVRQIVPDRGGRPR
jgi:hypothetical protein